MPTLQHGWVDGGLLIIMGIGLIGLIVTLVKRDRGIGSRAIQFVGACLVIPAVVILALEDKVDKQNVGTVLGAIIGYVLAGIGESGDKSNNPPPSSQQDSTKPTSPKNPDSPNKTD